MEDRGGSFGREKERKGRGWREEEKKERWRRRGRSGMEGGKSRDREGYEKHTIPPWLDSVNALRADKSEP